MAGVEKQNLISAIREIAPRIYLIDELEMKKLLESVDILPEEGLRASLGLLKEAQAKQDEILKKLASKNPHLDKNLKKFLHTEYMDHAKQAGLAEKEHAETFLNNL